MNKRIFRAIFGAAMAALLASFALLVGLLYTHFSSVQQGELRTQLALAKQGVEQNGLAYLDGLTPRDTRLTWIAADGSVLYDSASEAAAMENHLDRPEVRDALAVGYGESSRYSGTLLERYLYAAQQLDDGTVLRLALTQNSVLALVLGMLQPCLIIFGGAVILAFWLAGRLSESIVAPLNALDLDHPLKNEEYGELSPLLRRIDSQQKQLAVQTQALCPSRDELETVTYNLREGMILLGPDGLVLSMNPAARRLLDAQGPVLNEPILTVCRNLDLQTVLAKAQQGTPAETVTQLPAGAYQLDASPVLSDGEVRGVAVLLFDVTERQKAEQLRREFSANVSHELKTPLHVISGYAELLMLGMVKPEDIASSGEKIHAEAMRMTQLVQDIIELSHLDEGAKDLVWEPVDLYAAAQNTVQSLTAQAEQAQVSVSLQGDSAVIDAVPRLVDQILHNLCDNAIKYNRPGGHVWITVAAEADDITLAVQDDGIGIPDAQQTHVFERFYRVDKSRSKAVNGTGLGLSIVKHAAEVLGAKVLLESEENKGTTISIQFGHQKQKNM